MCAHGMNIPKGSMQQTVTSRPRGSRGQLLFTAHEAMMCARPDGARSRRAPVYALFLCALAATLWVRPAAAGGSRRHTLTRADLAYLRREAAMFGTGFSPPPAVEVPRRVPHPPSATPDSPRVPSREATGDVSARRDAVLQNLERSGAVRRCWTGLLLRSPTAEARTLQLTLYVDASGLVTAIDVPDGRSPELARCIARAGSAMAPVGPGDPVEARTTVTLQRGE